MHELDLANICERSPKLQGRAPGTVHELDLVNIHEHSPKLQGQAPGTVHDRLSPAPAQSR